MENADQVKALRRELGRREKKIRELERRLKGLQAQLEEERTGGRQLRLAADGLLTAAVLAWGEENQGEKRLRLPRFNAEQMRTRYRLHACRDQGGESYILSVKIREEGA